jgi:hypothetical protein
VDGRVKPDHDEARKARLSFFVKVRHKEPRIWGDGVLVNRLKKLILAVAQFTKWYTFIQVARVLGFLRSTPQIRSVWPEGEMALGPRVVLFMHFDRYGGVRPQLLKYMEELAASGRSVVFVTNAGMLTEAAEAAVRAICVGVIIRKNIGYDFGAWRAAIDHLNLPLADTQELILANDSVFGPLAPLGDVLDRLDYGAADVWGLTESWQVKYHLQSFFIAFGPVALRAPAFKTFWAGVRPVPAKSYVVKTYEIGVTQAMVRGGLRCSALWSYEALLKAVDVRSFTTVINESETPVGKLDPIIRNRRLQVLRLRDAIARRVALNPTSDMWRQLLLAGFPFIKRELLRDNPTKVEDVGEWVDLVRDVLVADPDPILVDLRTMLKDTAP